MQVPEYTYVATKGLYGISEKLADILVIHGLKEEGQLNQQIKHFIVMINLLSILANSPLILSF